MGIRRHPAVGVLDQDKIAEAAQLVAGIGDDAVIGGNDRRSLGGGDIDPVIVRAALARAEIDQDRAAHRPLKPASGMRRIGKRRQPRLGHGRNRGGLRLGGLGRGRRLGLRRRRRLGPQRRRRKSGLGWRRLGRRARLAACRSRTWRDNRRQRLGHRPARLRSAPARPGPRASAPTMAALPWRATRWRAEPAPAE